MTIDGQAQAPHTNADAVVEIADRPPGASSPELPTGRHHFGHWLKMHWRQGFVIAALLIVVIGVIALVLPKLAGGRSGALELAPVTRGNIEANVTALGNIKPKNYVDVGAQVSGQIKALHVKVGDRVKKGDLLAEIDAQVQQARTEADRENLASFQAQLVDKQAQLLLKKTQYERQVRLDKDGATSKDALQSAKAAFDSQKAQIDALGSQIKQAQSTLQADTVTLGYARIVAPMDGTIVSLPARLGQTLNSVQQAPTILSIADLSLMEVWTQVSEADVTKLKVGMPAYFTTLGNPNRRYNGTLGQILPTPETVNNVILYSVLFDVPNPDGSLMTQMTAQVFFVTASAKDVLTIPVSSVQPVTGRDRSGGPNGRNGRGANGAAPAGPTSAAGSSRRGAPADSSTANHAFVEVLGADGSLDRRMVETGVSDRVNIEIKSGLKEGERVVVGKGQTTPKLDRAADRGSGGSLLQSAGRPGGGRGLR